MDPFDTRGSRIPKMSLPVDLCSDELLFKRYKLRLLNITNLLQVCYSIFFFEFFKALFICFLS